MIGRALAVIVALALVPAIASADPAGDRAALTQLEAAYQATARLTGPARTNQACADAAKLSAAGSVSYDIAPADAAVDDLTWSSAAGPMARSLADLAKVCKAPDRKLPGLGAEVRTADQVVQELDDNLNRALNTARPRAVSPTLKAAQAAIAAMLGSMRAICTQQPKLVKALAQCPKPPAGVAPAAWKEAYEAVKSIADDLKSGACGRHRAADEQIGSSLTELHDNFYKLVLLVPPR